METIERVRSCLVELGLVVDENYNLQTLLSDYIVDSILFISFIIQIESEFEIEINDDFLSPNKLKTIADVVEMIESIRK